MGIVVMLACVRSTLSAAIDEAIRVEFESVVKEALGTPRLSDEETRRLFEENRETFEWLRDLALTKPGYVRFGPGQLDMDERRVPMRRSPAAKQHIDRLLAPF